MERMEPNPRPDSQPGALDDPAGASLSPAPGPVRERLFRIIFEADTPAGKAFDVVLLAAILLSVITVMLETVPEVHQRWNRWLVVAEWVFTLLFTLEYALRLYCVRERRRYVFSFFGIVDLLSILPAYVGLFWVGRGVESLLTIRALRLLRVFRILKLVHLLGEATELWAALWLARGKVLVFLMTVVIAVCIMGTGMYVIENSAGNEGFSSLPQSMYWAVVTMSTVGYGDVTPHTAAGKMLASIIIVFGYSLIIVPTSFVTAEAIRGRRRRIAETACERCGATGHQDDARYCRRCAERLGD